MPDLAPLTPATARDFLRKLSDLGISFVGHDPSPFLNYGPYDLSIDEVLAWVADRDDAIAKANHATRAEYHAWQDANGHLRCCARTKAGRPCKGIVPGGGNLMLREWAERTRIGELCASHQ